ncbi:MAG: hypothetical protein KGP29_05465 [Proteobacteria bacterium]|nr:hypothetical protein [Pseudomonadota bacterium]
MKKIVKTSVILTLIFGVGIFLSVKIGILPNWKERFFYKKLESIASSGRQGVPLKELTNFNWDYVCSRSSYNPEEEVGYADFYFDDELVAKIRTGDVSLSSNSDDKLYFNFGEYVGKKSDKRRYDKCDPNFEPSYDVEIKIRLMRTDNYLIINFLY